MNISKLFFRLLKYIIILAVITFAGIIIAVNVLDPNTYKADINKQVTKITGQDFEVQGKIQWSVFPDISLYLQDATLKNNKKFGDDDFIKAKEIHVKLKLLPLLFKQFEVKGIELREIQINLERNKSGETNFDALISRLKGETEKTNVGLSNATTSTTKPTAETKKTPVKSVAPTNSVPASKKSGFSTPKINIKEIIIRDSKLIWEDRKENKHYMLSNFNLKSKDLNLKSKKKLPPIETDGYITDVKNMPEKKLYFKTTIIPNLKTGTLNVKPFQIQFQGAVITSNLSVEDFMQEKRSLKGNLKIEPFSPAKILESLKPKNDTKFTEQLPKEVSGSADILFKDDTLALNSLILNVDKGQLKGNINYVLNFRNALDFNLNSENLNLSELGVLFYGLASVKPMQGEKKAQGQKTNINTHLKTLNVKGNFNASNVIVSDKLTIDSLNFKALGTNGVIQLAPIQAKFLDSTHDMTLKADLTQKSPLIEMSEKAENFRIEKILNAFDQKQVISGNASLSALLLMRGLSLNEYKNSLSGGGKILIKNGNIHGVDLKQVFTKAAKSLNELYNAIKGDPKLIISNLLDSNAGKFETKTKSSDKTSFNSLSASFTIKNGILNNRDLKINGSYYSITGDGNVNIPKNSINYIAKAQFNANALNEDTKVNKILTKYPIEVRITGNLKDPKITPLIKDYMDRALKDAQKSAIEKFTDKALKKILGDDENGEGGKIKLDKIIDIFR